MRIVHINELAGDVQGGGGLVAVNRLHAGLKKAGVESSIICARKSPGFEDAVEIRRSIAVKIAERLIGGITRNLGLNEVNNFSCLSILRMPEFQEAHIVHLHLLFCNYFSYLALPTLARRKPIVFTIHDMWPFTGHCAYSDGCERWMDGCGSCPHPDTFPAIRRDNTRLEWKLKERVYKRTKPTVITISDAIDQQVRQSMLSAYPIHLIPHGIDTQVYAKLDSQVCRSSLGIKDDRKVILFGASDMNRPEKGRDLLEAALGMLPPRLKEQITLLSFGNHCEGIAMRTGLHSINLGFVGGDNLKAAIYSAADIFVHPSRQETFGLVVLESIACGTPVVAFDVGGAAGMVHTGSGSGSDSTGYLAEPENSADLCKGMVELLDNDYLRREMGENCRKLTMDKYDVKKVIEAHCNLYRNILRSG